MRIAGGRHEALLSIDDFIHAIFDDGQIEPISIGEDSRNRGHEPMLAATPVRQMLKVQVEGT